MHGLELINLKSASFTDRLLNRKPKENAAIELNNYIASTPILEVARDLVERLLLEYKHGISEAKPAFVLLYRQILAHFALDKEISEAEQEQLRHLQSVFGLQEHEIADLEKAVLLPIYQKVLAGALADNELSQEERDYLEQLPKDLQLSESLAKDAFIKQAKEVLQNTLEQAISDRRLSPAEEAELQNLAQSLGIRMDYDQPTEEALERFRLLQRISTGVLPVVDTPIHLQKGELCHGYVGANHYELRTITKAVRYAGVGTRIRVMKGVYIKAGQIHSQRIAEDVMKLLDTGTLYFTNKRLLFDGAKKNTQIPLKKIIDFDIYQDGIKVEKETGKDQLFEFRGDAELVGAVMEVLLNESRY